MMAAAARISGTTLPVASVRYRGVFASARALADRGGPGPGGANPSGAGAGTGGSRRLGRLAVVPAFAEAAVGADGW